MPCSGTIYFSTLSDTHTIIEPLTMTNWSLITPLTCKLTQCNHITPLTSKLTNSNLITPLTCKLTNSNPLASPKKSPFNKISSYQGFTSKQTPIGWVRYHLRTVVRNPRRIVELIMDQIKCKQSHIGYITSGLYMWNRTSESSSIFHKQFHEIIYPT